ncbi:hypothetical protein HDV05_000113 [Chytridiales sp. JEL 0842]|nr:hypothetical protein HDV05_000113 [Chytridiales sp. JEL 0842]
MSAPSQAAAPTKAVDVKKPKDSFWVALGKDFLAGGISGTISKTAMAPVERVKLIIQTQDANPLIRSGQVPRYTGIGNTFSRVFNEQGFLSFWRGNFSNIIRYFPTQAINLASKDAIKSLFPKYNPATDFGKFFIVNIFSGGAAGAFSSFFVYPLDYARTRLASDVGTNQKSFNGLWDCLVKTARGPRGVLGLYQGFGISVAGIIPYRGVQFGLNDTIKGLNPWDKEVTLRGVASKWVGAQISVILSGMVAYPFDTVRRRLQMQAEKKAEDRIYAGALDCFKKIVREEGVKALFKGNVANILRGTGAALVLVLYGEFSAAIKRQ